MEEDRRGAAWGKQKKAVRRGPRKYVKGAKIGQKHASGKHASGSRKGFNWHVDLQAAIDIGGSRFCVVERVGPRQVKILPGDLIE